MKLPFALGWVLAACSPPAAAYYAGPPAPPPVQKQIVNHSKGPLCRIDLFTPQEFKVAWAASSPADCIGPGASRTLTLDTHGYQDDQLALVAYETVDFHRPWWNFERMRQINLVVDRRGPGPLVLVDPAELPDTALRDDKPAKPDQWVTQDARFRQLDINNKELDRVRNAEVKASNERFEAQEAKERKQGREQCARELPEPRMPARGFALAGKWSCSGDGIKAVVRIIGSGDTYSINEDIFDAAGRSSFDFTGHAHGRRLWTASNDGEVIEQADEENGGMRLTLLEAFGPKCTKYVLLCTK